MKRVLMELEVCSVVVALSESLPAVIERIESERGTPRPWNWPCPASLAAHQRNRPAMALIK
jgi:hypothetical protein